MFLINPYILQASGNPLWDGLLAYYTADNTPNDALGNYNGTLVNGATYGTGIINQGFSFDGVNDYITTGSRVGFSKTDSFTFSAWVKANALANRQLVTNNDVINGCSLAIRSDGTFKMSLTKGNVNGIAYANTTLTTGTWYHMVISHSPYNGSTNNVKFFLNGVADGSVIFDVGIATVSTEQRIGTSISNIGFFNGMIDEVGVWNRELTATEVTELYNSGAGKQYPN